jgi:G3E family GTPase
MEIPVYVFTGFLESGKTKMVHETMADKRFQNKERTLIIVCEEGVEEYDVSKYSVRSLLKPLRSRPSLPPKTLRRFLQSTRQKE